MKKRKQKIEAKPEDVSGQAWRGSFDRPMKVDRQSYDPLTLARMTDHNVRGVDDEWDHEMDKKRSDQKSEDKKKL
jgi:hypothetical protein